VVLAPASILTGVLVPTWNTDASPLSWLTTGASLAPLMVTVRTAMSLRLPSETV
jgi:hypothetical protein